MRALSVFQSFITMEATFTPKVDKKLMSDLIQPMAFRATGTDLMSRLGWVQSSQDTLWACASTFIIFQSPESGMHIVH